MKTTGVTASLIGCFILLSGTMITFANADIYFLRDKTGTLRFTNTPNTPKYKPLSYLKIRRKAAVRTRGQTHFDGYIRETAAQYKIPRALIKSIIKVESNFNPRAVSAAGASGLMQIMPENFSGLSLKNPYNPRENIDAGTRYFRKLLNLYNGKVHLALAAYNAGPGAVKKHRGIPPYEETQKFVLKVMKYYRTYQREG